MVKERIDEVGRKEKRKFKRGKKRGDEEKGMEGPVKGDRHQCDFESRRRRTDYILQAR